MIEFSNPKVGDLLVVTTSFWIRPFNKNGARINHKVSTVAEVGDFVIVLEKSHASGDPFCYWVVSDMTRGKSGWVGHYELSSMCADPELLSSNGRELNETR